MKVVSFIPSIVHTLPEDIKRKSRQGFKSFLIKSDTHDIDATFTDLWCSTGIDRILLGGSIVSQRSSRIGLIAFGVLLWPRSRRLFVKRWFDPDFPHAVCRSTKD